MEAIEALISLAKSRSCGPRFCYRAEDPETCVLLYSGNRLERG